MSVCVCMPKCVFLCSTFSSIAHHPLPTAKAMFQIQVSNITGTMLWVAVARMDSINTVKFKVHQADVWYCGTPMSMLIPLAINVDMRLLMVNGGSLRVSTWDGEMFQDWEHATMLEHGVDNVSHFFKVMCMKQVDPDGLEKDELNMSERKMLLTISQKEISNVHSILPNFINSNDGQLDEAIGPDMTFEVNMKMHKTPFHVSAVYGSQLKIPMPGLPGALGLNCKGVTYTHQKTADLANQKRRFVPVRNTYIGHIV